jgi:hypothetical protein
MPPWAKDAAVMNHPRLALATHPKSAFYSSCAAQPMGLDEEDPKIEDRGH